MSDFTKPWLNKARTLLRQSLNSNSTELNELDWKESVSPNSKRLAEHLCAFGNYPGGGFLVFGIARSGEVIGLKTRAETDQVLTTLGNIARDGIVPALQLDHAVEQLDNLDILFVQIPESAEKPVHVKGKGIECSYIRSAGQTRQMSKQELGQSLMNSKIPRYEELEAFTSESLSEVLEKLDYSKYFELQTRPVPQTPEKIAEVLSQQKLITLKSNRYGITNLGVLLCAKNIQDFPGHERRGVRVVVYKDKTRIEATKEKVGRFGYAIGFQGMIEFILACLPSSEIIRDALRHQVSIYPAIAIRELLANAIIHQDLSVTTASPMVEIFSNRMEISNPGRLLPSITVDRIIDTSPESRNEALARSMRQLGICEERGSGIDKTIQSIEMFGLPPLEFTEQSNSFKATIYTPKKYKEMEQHERILATYQHCVLKFVANDKMTNASLRKRLGVSEANYPMVSKIINAAIAAGKVKKGSPEVKARKYTYYLPYWV